MGLSRSFGTLWHERAHASLLIKGLLLAVQSCVCGLGILALCARREPQLTVGQVHFWCNVVVYVGLMAVPRYSMVLLPILIPHALSLLVFERVAANVSDDVPEQAL